MEPWEEIVTGDKSNEHKAPKSFPKDVNALKLKLKRQLEYYFSRENLAQDAFLVSQMNSGKYVPIAIIASFKKVKSLTSDLDLIVEVMRHSDSLSVDDAGKMVRPTFNVERTTMILRDISSSAEAEEVEALFESKCGKILSVRSDVGDNWFVSFETETHCTDAIDFLRDKTFKGKQIHCRVKSENLLRSFYAPPVNVSGMSYPYATSPPTDQFSPNSSEMRRMDPGANYYYPDYYPQQYSPRVDAAYPSCAAEWNTSVPQQDAVSPSRGIQEQMFEYEQQKMQQRMQQQPPSSDMQRQFRNQRQQRYYSQQNRGGYGDNRRMRGGYQRQSFQQYSPGTGSDQRRSQRYYDSKRYPQQEKGVQQTRPGKTKKKTRGEVDGQEQSSAEDQRKAQQEGRQPESWQNVPAGPDHFPALPSSSYYSAGLEAELSGERSPDEFSKPLYEKDKMAQIIHGILKNDVTMPESMKEHAHLPIVRLEANLSCSIDSPFPIMSPASPSPTMAARPDPSMIMPSLELHRSSATSAVRHGVDSGAKHQNLTSPSQKSKQFPKSTKSQQKGDPQDKSSNVRQQIPKREPQKSRAQPQAQKFPHEKAQANRRATDVSSSKESDSLNFKRAAKKSSDITSNQNIQWRVVAPVSVKGASEKQECSSAVKQSQTDENTSDPTTNVVASQDQNQSKYDLTETGISEPPHTSALSEEKQKYLQTSTAADKITESKQPDSATLSAEIVHPETYAQMAGRPASAPPSRTTSSVATPRSSSPKSVESGSSPCSPAVTSRSPKASSSTQPKHISPVELRSDSKNQQLTTGCTSSSQKSGEQQSSPSSVKLGDEPSRLETSIEKT